MINNLVEEIQGIIGNDKTWKITGKSNWKE